MGVYFYTLQRLPKPVLVTREDGAVASVEARLVYRTKAGAWEEDDRRIERSTDRAREALGDNYRGFVAHGGIVIAWDGDPTWYDTGDFPGEVWGYRPELKGGKSYGKTARLPALNVQVLHHGDKRPTTYRLERRIAAHHHYEGDQWQTLLEERIAYAVRRADGRVEFRVEGKDSSPRDLRFDALLVPEGVEGLALRDLLNNYALVAQDRLIELTPVPPRARPALVVPAPAPVPAAPSHEDCLRAAGWIS